MTVDNQRSSLEQKINGFKPRKAVDVGENKEGRSFWEDGQTTETGEDQCKKQLHQTGQVFSREANTMLLQAELKEEFGKLSEQFRSVQLCLYGKGGSLRYQRMN